MKQFLSKVCSCSIKVLAISVVLNTSLSCTEKINEAKVKNGTSKEATPVKVFFAEKKLLSRIINVAVDFTGKKQLDVFSRVPGRISFEGPAVDKFVKAGELLFKVDRTDPSDNFLETPVLSPISGWISKWNINVGTQISTQDAVVTVVDDSVLSADVFIPTTDWALVSKTTKINVTIENKKQKANIVTIARAADSLRGQGSFQIEVSNANRLWKAGMTGKVEIQLEPKERLLIPTQALILTDQGSFTYIVEDNIAKKVPVVFEVFTNDFMEIKSGLSNKVRVIIDGNNNVSDKSKVQIVGGNEGQKK